VAALAEGQGAAATSADANGETSGAADLLSAYPPAPSPAVAQPRLAAPNGAKGEVVRAESSAAPQEPGVVVQHGLMGAVLGAPSLLRLPAALGLPGSSCRRGAHGKQGWTREEDQQILQHVQTTGPKWSSIAEALPGRTDDAVRKLPKNFTAISMMQSVKRKCIAANSTAAKRCCTDDAQALAHAAHMCKVQS
jgi:hypothetical protein